MERVSTDLESCLSVQERKIARLLAWGYTQKEIAGKLLRNIYRKLSIHKETDLCRWWIFFEYCIADNPLKRVIAVFLLALSINMILHETDMLRVFRSFSSKTATRVVRASRARRRYENVFDLHLALTV